MTMKDESAEKRREKLRKDIDFVEHTWPEGQLYQHFSTDPERGLTSNQVLLNREQYGANVLTPPKLTPWWVKYLKQYSNFFAILLMVAGVLCFIAYFIDKNHDTTNLYLGIVLIIVVVITATFAYATEAKSEKVMEGFRKLIPARCQVMRDGRLDVVDASELVPGDVVELGDGDRVPADIRIIKATDLKVDNSSLTGESEPVDRTNQLALDSNGNVLMQPLEAHNLVFYTTIVCSGSARGVVIGSGDRTVMGQIAGLATETSNLETPIAIEIANFVRLISGLAIFMGILFFILSIVIGNPVIQTVVFAIGVIVANVPEGLMAAVTVSLALAAKRMHAKNVLVKNLQSVETLGSCTVIASDKTGTLTQNRMTVQHCWYDLQIMNAPAARNSPEWVSLVQGESAASGMVYNPQAPTFTRLHLIAALCNNANFVTAGIDMEEEMKKEGFNMLTMECSGDASEQGLLKFVEPIRSAAELRQTFPKVFEIKFNSTNKWQLSIHDQSSLGPGLPPLLVLKGAPERVLSRCTHIMVEGRVQPLTEDLKQRYNSAYEQLGGFGERVLGFAYSDLNGYTNDFEFTNKPEPNFPTQNLVFVGLFSLIDPPREGVPDAVAKCKRARIKVFMVTGDHPITARAIAKQVGILDQDKLDSGNALVVSGDNIREWLELPSPEEQLAKWDHALNHDQLVFARVSPAHKLLIVENCQRRGEIVAVTGDGVNDAPALKKGDIGVAMGISGKDVSKEAADMILMDDNFASIVNGVEEGRLIFDNLKKTICYALTVNIPELIPFLCNVIIGIPLPLSTVLMLAICLGTDMVPAIALAYEEKESDIMHRPPRNAKTERLVGGKLVSHAYLMIGVVQAFAGFLAYMIVLNDYGYVPGILAENGLLFTTNSLICTVDDKNIPIKCGYGCDVPNYNKGLPEVDSVKYCEDGCPAPLPRQPVDPFSEFDHNGFKGANYCDLSCDSEPSMFPGKVLPEQCSSSNSTFRTRVGFPGRNDLGSPHAPVGGKYWWGGKLQVQPNYLYQKQVLYYAQSAYFVACVVTQWANLVICKTRKLSVFEQGMRNNVLNFGLVFETVVAALLLYVPPLQTVFSTRPANLIYWLCGVPFALAIFGIGEWRKLLIRKFPGGWVDRWTYW